ncbi:MAG: hypothetical protein A3F16_04345 [Deltaproteobacteria bacterium RIFCSPHIGHO2_12_FULL_43_9]|nr:MAG: hypothetical protein A3F16_04345 [Deltaproteobacteria bacterium RIFCSPHIGHO2_12_FULL_43_9]
MTIPRRALVVTTPRSILKESLQELFHQAQLANLEPWCFVNLPKEDLAQVNDTIGKEVRLIIHEHSSLAGRLDEILELLEKDGIEEAVILTDAAPKMDILWIQRALEMVSLGKTVVRQGGDGGILFLAAKLPFSARFCEPGGYKPKRGDHFITWLRWNGKDVVHLAPSRVQSFHYNCERQSIKRIRST